MKKSPKPEVVERLYAQLSRVRLVEEEVARIYPSDKIKSPVHLSIGQEAITVAVCDALKPDDAVTCTYRGHAVYITRGGSLKGMLAEMFGKRTGCAGGKGGSMHLVDPEHNVLGASAVVGTTVPLSAGFALAQKKTGKKNVVVAFFGDGATEEGGFYETLNFAVLHQLPVLFVCENNGLAIHQPLHKRWGAPDLCTRISGFGMPTRRFPKMDVFQLQKASRKAVNKIRNGGGPQLFECCCYRWYEHVGPTQDYDAGYRVPEDLQPWVKDDQVKRLAKMLPKKRRKAIDEAILSEIAEAVQFAEESPVPPPSDLYANVYA